MHGTADLARSAGLRTWVVYVKILKPVFLMVAEVGNVASLSREMGKEHTYLSLFTPSGPSAMDVGAKQFFMQRE